MFQQLAAIGLLMSVASIHAAEPTAKPRVDQYGDPLPAGAIQRLGSVRFKHSGYRLKVVVHPNEQVVLTTGWGAGDRAIRVWEMPTGRELAGLPADATDGFSTMAVSPDGVTIAAAGGQQVRLFDFASRKELRRWNAGRVRCLTFTPDGKTVITGGEDHDSSIRLFDVATGKERRRMRWHDRGVDHLLVTPDGRTLIAIGYPGQIHFSDINTGREIKRLAREPCDEIYLADLSKDGKTLVIGGQGTDRKNKKSGAVLALIDPATAEVSRIIDSEHDINIHGGFLTADGRWLLSQDYRGSKHVIDMATAKVDRKLHCDGAPLHLCKDGKTLLCATQAGLLLWDFVKDESIFTPAGHFGEISSLSFSMDGRRLAAGSFAESFARVWDTTAGNELCKLKGHGDPDKHPVGVPRVAFMPDGARIATGSSDSTLRLWDAATGKELRKFTFASRQQVTFLGVVADGAQLLSISLGFDDSNGENYLVSVWEIATGKVLLERREADPFGSFGRWVITRDGKRYVKRTEKGVSVCEVDTGHEFAALPVQDSPIGPYALSPDGKLAAIRTTRYRQEGPRHIAENAMTRIWDYTDRKEVQTIPLPGFWTAMTFSPDGRRIAAAVGEELLVWDVASGKELHRNQAGSRVSALGFSTDGRLVATGLSNGTILIWDVSSSSPK